MLLNIKADIEPSNTRPSKALFIKCKSSIFQEQKVVALYVLLKEEADRTFWQTSPWFNDIKYQF